MKIAIVDDNRLDLEFFLKLIDDYSKKYRKIIQVKPFLSGEDFLNEFPKENFSAVFLDIYMESMTGVEVARKIRQTDENIRLIFTTSSDEHFLDGFEVEATHYLLKPLSFEKVENVMHRLRSIFAKEESMITLPNGNKEIQVPKNQILYIETIRNGITLYCKDKTIPLRCSISMAMEILESHNFLRCHRYYAVNLDAVEKIENDSFVMSDGTHILLRREGRKELKEIYYRYFMSKLPEDA